MRIAVIGGTGAEGFGLALRLAAAGHGVTIGSRDAERAEAAAVRAKDRLDDGADLRGAANGDATAAGEVVFVTVPFAGQAEIYRSIAGRLASGTPVLDATSPLATAVGGRPWQVVRPWHGSAVEQARALVGDRARLVAGFHTIAAAGLQDLGAAIDSDVLLCGDDAEAKTLFGGLIEQIPSLRWVDCGGLSMARVAETLTALLISINRTYGSKDAGFRISGREAWGTPPA